RYGTVPDRNRLETQVQLSRLVRAYRKLASGPEPEPRSIALALAQGRKPDAATADILNDVLTKASTPAPGGKVDEAAVKQLADTLEKLKAKPHFDVAAAAWD